jgi:hypothetical protein
VNGFSRKAWHGGGDTGTSTRASQLPNVLRQAAPLASSGRAMRWTAATHGTGRVGALRAAPLPAHGAEAEAVADGGEAADDLAKEVVREVGPRPAAAEARSLRHSPWHGDRPWLNQTRRTHDFLSAHADV